VPVYTATLDIIGEFKLDNFYQFKKKSTIRMVDKAFLSIGVLDSWGLVERFQKNCQQLASVSYGVGHIEPVDIYLQSLRAIKYGMLII